MSSLPSTGNGTPSRAQRKHAFPVRVRGESMRPTLPPGALVVAVPLDGAADPRPGDIVIARRPDRPEQEIIKRVLTVTADGEYVLAGDNPAASTESVDFGPVPRRLIVARVRWRYWPLPPRALRSRS